MTLAQKVSSNIASVFYNNYQQCVHKCVTSRLKVIMKKLYVVKYFVGLMSLDGTNSSRDRKT